MVEPQPEVVDQEGEGLLRVLLVAEQGVADPDFDDPGGVAVAGHPRADQPVDRVVLPGVEGVQGVVVIVVLGPGDEPGEGRRPGLRQGEKS